MRHVAKRWLALCSQQPPKTNFDAWIHKWQVCYTEALDVGLDEFRRPERISGDFLEAIIGVLTEFTTVWLDRIYSAK